MDVQAMTARLPVPLHDRLREAAFVRRGSSMNDFLVEGLTLRLGDVLPQALLDAIEFRKLMNGCRVCENGHPCQECVIDAQRLREYGEALALLGGSEPLP